MPEDLVAIVQSSEKVLDLGTTPRKWIATNLLQ